VADGQQLALHRRTAGQRHNHGGGRRTQPAQAQPAGVGERFPHVTSRWGNGPQPPRAA
jgi:hypothetical protein